MAEGISFDPYLGWVDVVDPNNVPPDVRTIGAADLLRYEKLGQDTVTKFSEVEQALADLDSDAAIATSLAQPESQTRVAIQGLVDTGVAGFQAVIDAVPAEVDTQVSAAVPPLVTSALAADSTVANAAASAVGTELNAAGVFKGATPITWVQDEIALSFTDKNGFRFWLESGFDGKPTAHARQILTDVLAQPVSIAAAAELGMQEISDVYEWAWVVTDQQDKILGGWHTDGTFSTAKLTLPNASVSLANLDSALADLVTTDPARPATASAGATTLITSRLNLLGQWELRSENLTTGTSTLLYTGKRVADVTVSADNTTVYFSAVAVGGTTSRTMTVPVAGGTVRPAVPVTALIAHGDSMTHGMGGGYGIYAWPAVAATDLGIPYFNSGLSAQTSTEIATDQGGIKPTFTVAGNTIPATGPVTLTNVAPTGTWRAGWEWTWLGYLHGVYGTLKKSTAEVWTFTRATDGAAVATPNPATFESEQGKLYADWIQTFWIGRNNVNQAINVRDMDAMVSILTPQQKYFLVFPIFNTTGEPSGSSGYNNLMAINNAWAAQYGSRYVDTRRWIIDNGLAAAGIVATAADTTAIAEDRIPPSLMADSTHLNATGYNVLGKYIASVIRQKGWV
jgi:hypothetical protein